MDALIDTSIASGNLNGKVSVDSTGGTEIVLLSATAGTTGDMHISTWNTNSSLNLIDSELYGICDKYGELRLMDTVNGTWTSEFSDMGWGSSICKPVLFADNSLLRLTDANFTDTFSDSTCDYNNDPTITMDSTRELAVGMAVSGTGIPAGAKVDSIASNGTTFELEDASGSALSTTGGAVTDGTLTFTFTNENRIVGPVYKPGLFNSQRGYNKVILFYDELILATI